MLKTFLLSTRSETVKKLQRWGIIGFVTLCIAAGMGLSIYSFLEVCTDACSETKHYTLFGMPFAVMGLAFFTVASLLWIYVLRNPEYLPLLALLFSVALGAELFFVYVQKYWIGKWCPVCLSIFMCVAFLWLFFTLSLLDQPSSSSNPVIRRLTMRPLNTLFSSFGAILLGFLVVFLGVAHPQLADAQQIGKEPIYFGSRHNALEMYVFTDWFCPACRKAEPSIEQQAPGIARKAKLFFIDIPLHESSMNYVPYNLSFMLKEKTKYLKLRHQLTQLSEKKAAPAEKEVEEIALAQGTTYQQLDYAQVSQGIQYFKEVAKRYGVETTPTVVLVNPATQQMRKLEGAKSIRAANFLQLLDDLTETSK